jgi:hypothetical protein
MHPRKPSSTRAGAHFVRRHGKTPSPLLRWATITLIEPSATGMNEH